MKINKKLTFTFECPVHGEIEVSEIMIDNKNLVICNICKSHLGYPHDLPEEIRGLVK
jgi:transcription elongation factor Elf1